VAELLCVYVTGAVVFLWAYWLTAWGELKWWQLAVEVMGWPVCIIVSLCQWVARG
jgi:hypothetical protein